MTAKPSGEKPCCYSVWNSTTVLISGHLTSTYSENRFHDQYQTTVGASAWLKYVACVLEANWLVSLYGSYSA